MKNIIITAILLFGQFALSHGENKPGPHRGYIRMPGAFHTEVVPINATDFQVFLLDLNWQKPTVVDSSVQAKVVSLNKEIAFGCNKDGDHFMCKIPTGFSLNRGQLILKAKRENSTGADAIYELPLNRGQSPVEKPHEGHTNGH
jgi:hypothetical protein